MWDRLADLSIGSGRDRAASSRSTETRHPLRSEGHGGRSPARQKKDAPAKNSQRSASRNQANGYSAQEVSRPTRPDQGRLKPPSRDHGYIRPLAAVPPPMAPSSKSSKIRGPEDYSQQFAANPKARAPAYRGRAGGNEQGGHEQRGIAQGGNEQGSEPAGSRHNINWPDVGEQDLRRSTRRRRNQTVDPRRGEGRHSLYVLIWRTRLGHLCGSHITAHWALYNGPARGTGVLHDSFFQGPGSHGTEVSSFSGRPEYYSYEDYSVERSRSGPRPFYVAHNVPRRRVEATCRSVLQDFRYNVVLNNCQSYILKVLETLKNQGDITTDEYDAVLHQTVTWWAPAHRAG